MTFSYSVMAFCSLPCWTNFSAALSTFVLLNPNPSAIETQTESGVLPPERAHTIPAKVIRKTRSQSLRRCAPTQGPPPHHAQNKKPRVLGTPGTARPLRCAHVFLPPQHAQTKNRAC